VVVVEVHAERPIRQIKISARTPTNICFFTVLPPFNSYILLCLRNQINEEIAG
jgi:hypothetical protein